MPGASVIENSGNSFVAILVELTNCRAMETQSQLSNATLNINFCLSEQLQELISGSSLLRGSLLGNKYLLRLMNGPSEVKTFNQSPKLFVAITL